MDIETEACRSRGPGLLRGAEDIRADPQAAREEATEGGATLEVLAQ